MNDKLTKSEKAREAYIVAQTVRLLQSALPELTKRSEGRSWNMWRGAETRLARDSGKVVHAHVEVEPVRGVTVTGGSLHIDYLRVSVDADSLRKPYGAERATQRFAPKVGERGWAKAMDRAVAFAVRASAKVDHALDLRRTKEQELDDHKARVEKAWATTGAGGRASLGYFIASREPTEVEVRLKMADFDALVARLQAPKAAKKGRAA
ncbi:hypothetical protein [Luteitalea sp.]|uniref:hypothetical protein n=1 Tax=Luteitalea sp. TaxID=2004800 RepID=UPI0025BC0241|nr:hypothetical protein [Luteitalea sp.]